MNEKINGLIYKCKSTLEMNNEEIFEFIKIFNNIFNENYDEKWYKWKYENNIYGESYFVLVYHKDNMVATRVFWRNDLEGFKSFQPVDTLVHKDYRKRGIFTNMSKVALQYVEDCNIYNFPNLNSLNGNLKLGWKLIYKYNLNLVLSKYLKNKNTINYIEDKYFQWRFLDCPINSYYYYKYDNRYYLLKKKKFNVYYVLGEFNSEFKNKLEEVKYPIMFYYSNKKNNFKIFNEKANLVARKLHENFKFIPITKNDTI